MPSKPALEHRRQRRGVALILVLIAVIVAATLAYSYVGTQSTSIAIARNINSHAKARYIAESGLELAFAYVRSSENWRTTQTNGVWINDKPFGEGTLTIVGEDGTDTDGDGVIEGDGDLSDSPTDPLTLTVTGKADGSSHVARAVLMPDQGITFEAGVTTADGITKTVQLGNIYVNPVVVCTVNYRNSSIPVVARVSNATSSSFDLRLQNPSDQAVVQEIVSYIVMEQGAWEIDGLKCEAQTYTSTVTDRSSSWKGEEQEYKETYSNPVVLGQVMTENDADWSVFWCRGSSSSNPPSKTKLYTGKTVCEDTDTARNSETIGFMVIESGQGTIGGVPFECALGSDKVCGIDNSPPYTYGFSTPFSSNPSVVIACQAAMDGTNGGWALSYGDPPATTSQIRLVIDEDQIKDKERNHTPEQVGYLVFESPVNVSRFDGLKFGFETAFTNDQSNVDRKQIATQVTLPAAGTLTCITAYVKDPPSKELRYAVYTDSDGQPGALIVETDAKPVGSDSFHWHAINTSPTTLAAGTYWLTLCFEHSDMYYKYIDSGGQTRYTNYDAVANGYLSSWDSSSDSSARRISIYATYTPASGSSSYVHYTIDWLN